ncbi:MAG: hypothetical protein A2086_10540 [Spirochaetes bacterium GWD1_27_9]|nr:MAG: hypothetical protein A2Z98_17775 [Spirochaetes bacterium GWB1_27_13]OHD21224.1 MAG: hypothetical protein A2Y34_08525 [Spirochaetes bacterium GWC1_27_15]OHD30914.1 MAG: hypothetical protein A2086_10540 [Spirochaetes bacterium GWD1_27_9]
MKKIYVLFLILIVNTIIFSQTSNKIVIGGTGANQDLLKDLAEQFMDVNKNTIVEVPDSIGSSGGIKAVIEGQIDIARVSRNLKDKEKETGLKYRKFALCPIVFASNLSVNVKNLKTEDILNIYSGKIKNWKELGGADLEIVVIGREEGDSSRATIEEAFPDFKKVKYREDIIIVNKDQDMIRKLKVKKGSIGFGTLANMNGDKLNIFSINNIKSDSSSYNLINAFAFVYFENKINSLAKKFLEFVYSEDGKKTIKSSFCEPIKE